MSAAQPKLSRRESKARSRERLVGATIHILRSEGAQGLTTGKVARAAGLSQPSFYVHFKDMDDALQAAATFIGNRVRKVLSEQRRLLRRERSRDTLSAAFSAALEALLSEPECTEVLLAHRRDAATPIGRCCQELLGAMRDDMLEDCRAMGLDESRLPQLELFVDLMNAMTLAVVEGFLDGRYEDRELCVEALFRATISVYGSLEPLGPSRAPSGPPRG